MTMTRKRDDHIYVYGTVKAAVLEGDTAFPYLFVSSVHKTNPVHYLSMVCWKFTRQVNEKDFSMWARGRRIQYFFKNEHNP